jgi:hypothetical protein
MKVIAVAKRATIPVISAISKPFSVLVEAAVVLGYHLDLLNLMLGYQSFLKPIFAILVHLFHSRQDCQLFLENLLLLELPIGQAE